MSTYIDGIGASENIDSSGERISIAGMDISSLAVDGVFNWEHNKDQPSQVVGKVLVAKKIFSEQDCDDERQLYFWNKCLTPYIYVMGELMDDYKESAKEVAGMFRYDNDRKGQQERNVMNFSIEGAKIDKKGMDIVKSIARKVTITVLPCNKAAVAEMVPADNKQPKDDIDSLFKAETSVEIELFKTEDMGKFLESLKKNAPALKLAPTAPSTPADPRGHVLGQTKTGKNVHANEKIHNYQGFSSQDHHDAANLHYKAIKGGGDPKTNQHHMGKMKLHMQASQSAERKEQRFAVGKQAAAKRTLDSGLFKASTAGSANAAPGQLTGTAATTPESVDKKLHKATPINNPAANQNPKGGESRMGAAVRRGHLSTARTTARNTVREIQKQPKNDFWLKRAEQEYAKWPKKEKFVEFMSKRMPNMTKTEIDVFGAALALKKSLENEGLLEGLNKALKFPEVPKASGDQDATPKPKVPEKFKGKAPEFKGKIHTEVEHVEPHYSSDGPDTVYLKSGHTSMGHKKGKFKVGDKVTATQHIQGTHLLEHGHND